MNLERKKEVEKLVIDILKKYKIYHNPGKELKKILDGEGIVYIAYSEWPDSKCGKFMYINDEPAIYCNSNHSEQRQAFTIAHELGHYFLNHLVDAELEIICLERDFERLDESDDEKKEREVEANFFAACMLLPLDLLQPCFDEFMKFIGRTGQLYVDTQPCNISDYKRCISFLQIEFLASETAIRYRLMNLGGMDFNLNYSPFHYDRGIHIAECLRRLDIWKQLI